MTENDHFLPFSPGNLKRETETCSLSALKSHHADTFHIHMKLHKRFCLVSEQSTGQGEQAGVLYSATTRVAVDGHFGNQRAELDSLCSSLFLFSYVFTQN